LRNCTTSGASASQTASGIASSPALDAIGQFAGVSRPLSGDHADLGQMASQPIDQLRALRISISRVCVAH